MKRTATINDATIKLKEVNISIEKGIFLITIDKQCICKDKHNLIIDASNRMKSNDKEDGKHVPSGIIVLCVCVNTEISHSLKLTKIAR